MFVCFILGFDWWPSKSISEVVHSCSIECSTEAGLLTIPSFSVSICRVCFAAPVIGCALLCGVFGRAGDLSSSILVPAVLGYPRLFNHEVEGRGRIRRRNMRDQGARIGV